MSGSPVVVLDIGATKVLCLVGESGAGNQVRVLGVGASPCAGLRRSVVIDMARVVDSIRSAVAEAERSAGLQIAGAYLGMAGHDSRARASRSTVAIAGVSKPIDEDDVARAMATAEQAAPDDGEQIMHRIVQSYAVDGQPVQNPLWLYGNKLEVETLSISASTQACTTLQRAADSAGIEIAGFILETVAAATAVVSLDEREMGVGILDIGAGTSDLAVFRGPLRHIAEIPFGGEDITRDLSVVLSMSPRSAQQLKHEHGCVCCPPEEGDQAVSFQTTAGRNSTLTRSQLSEIIEARQHEIFQFVQQELETHDCTQMLAAGLIVTGGGALLRNLPELGEEVLGMPVRVGLPQNAIAADSMNDPHYATGIGLLQFALEEHMESTVAVSANGSGRLVDRISRLLSFF